MQHYHVFLGRPTASPDSNLIYDTLEEGLDVYFRLLFGLWGHYLKDEGRDEYRKSVYAGYLNMLEEDKNKYGIGLSLGGMRIMFMDCDVDCKNVHLN